MTYDRSPQMSIAGATINLNCPTCGAVFDVHLNDTEPRQTARTVLDTWISFRCPACEHLGEVHLEMEVR